MDNVKESNKSIPLDTNLPENKNFRVMEPEEKDPKTLSDKDPQKVPHMTMLALGILVGVIIYLFISFF